MLRVYLNKTHSTLGAPNQKWLRAFCLAELWQDLQGKGADAKTESY